MITSNLPDDYVPSDSRLKYIGKSSKTNNKGYMIYQNYLCIPCGNTITRAKYDAKSGNTLSCGCLKSEQLANRNASHGMSKHKCYRGWAGMISRCHNVNHEDYEGYGGRGISVCDEWRSNFAQFVADMGDRPKGYSLDRIDNNGNYEPSNCRWTSQINQCNNKRSNVVLELDGISQTIAEWSRETGIKYSTIVARLDRGWTTADTLRLSVGCKK